MPGFDSTGPAGQGPRTGRQMGKCKPRKDSNETETDGGENGFTGRGLGRGLGRGRGRGRGF